MSSRSRGQSIVEVLIGVALGAVLITAAGTLIAPALRTNKQTNQVQTATALGKEMGDNVRAWAGGNWNSISNLSTTSANTYYLNTSQSPFTTASGTQSTTISGIVYSRYFYVDNMYRDSSGYATTTAAGNTYDPSTKKVTVVYGVSSSTTSTILSYVTRKANNVFNQTSWAGGSGQTGPITVASTSFNTSTNISVSSTPGSLVLTSSSVSTAIAFVQAASTSTGNATISVPFASANTAGNLIVVTVSVDNNDLEPWGVWDSAGNTYVKTASFINVPTHVSTYYSPNVKTAATNTVSSQIDFGANMEMAISEYSGVNAADVSHSASGTSAAWTSGTSTTYYASELLYGYGWTANNMTISAGTNFTKRTSQKTGAQGSTATEDQIVSATGSYSTPFTPDSSTSYIDQMVTFKSAVGATNLVASNYFSWRDSTATSTNVNEPISLPTVNDGNIVIVQLVITVSGSGGTDPGTITAPSGYTLIRSDAVSTYETQALYWHLWHTGDPTTLVFSWVNPGAPNGTISTWSSIDTSSPVATSSVKITSSSRSTSMTAPSITLSNTNDPVLVFTGAEQYFGNSFTQTPAGFTTWQTLQGDGVLSQLYFGTMDIPSSPTGTSTVTMSTALYNLGATVELKVVGSCTGTNISNKAGEYWAWNDAIGWIDFCTTNTVNVTSTGLTGYASSSAGYISLDCATSPIGNICGTSNYQVLNNGAGSLTGWGWNDTYGWISFCGGLSTSNCPGSTSYQVTIDSSNNFQGYAWSDSAGWISFNCDNNSSCGTSSFKLKEATTTGSSATYSTGTLDSVVFDTGAVNGAQINSVLWQGSAPAGTTVEFQLAVSNASSGPWTFMGSDGTSNTYYTGAAGAPIKVTNYGAVANYRYFRYRLTMLPDASGASTPQVDDITINWSP